MTPHKPCREEQHEKACYHRGNANHTPPLLVISMKQCHAYGKIGHIVQVCRSTQPVETIPWSSKLSATKNMHLPIDSKTDVIWQLRTDKANRPHPYQVALEVNQLSLTIEINTWAAVSLIPRKVNRDGVPFSTDDAVYPTVVNVYVGEHPSSWRNECEGEVWHKHVPY